MKSTLLNGQLTFNAAGFYIDWSDIQLQRFVTGPSTGLVINITDNAGEAVIKGIEMDAVWHPTDDIEIGSAITILDAQLDTVLEGVPLIPGSVLPGSADFSASNHIQFSSDSLPNDLSGYIRLGHRYVGESVSNINNAPELVSDKYHVFNARAGINFENYELSVYVENLADSEASTANFGLDALNVYRYRSYRLRPRTIGMNIRANF